MLPSMPMWPLTHVMEVSAWSACLACKASLICFSWLDLAEAPWLRLSVMANAALQSESMLMLREVSVVRARAMAASSESRGMDVVPV